MPLPRALLLMPMPATLPIPPTATTLVRGLLRLTRLTLSTDTESPLDLALGSNQSPRDWMPLPRALLLMPMPATLPIPPMATTLVSGLLRLTRLTLPTDTESPLDLALGSTPSPRDWMPLPRALLLMPMSAMLPIPPTATTLVRGPLRLTLLTLPTDTESPLDPALDSTPSPRDWMPLPRDSPLTPMLAMLVLLVILSMASKSLTNKIR